ncbi:MAG: sigma-70 family RNA polymerase sigma factor [Ginsengibacter sp.]
MKEAKLQEELFIEYLGRCKNLVFKIARMYCANEEDRKDLVQDIIVQLWKSFPKYNDEYAISTWTYRIALNVSISFLRKSRTKQRVMEDFQQHPGILYVDENVTDERLEYLYQFVGQLKPVDKAIMILYMEGCSQKEISSVMGMSETNVSTRKNRIHSKMKTFFETVKL